MLMFVSCSSFSELKVKECALNEFISNKGSGVNMVDRIIIGSAVKSYPNNVRVCHSECLDMQNTRMCLALEKASRSFILPKKSSQKELEQALLNYFYDVTPKQFFRQLEMNIGLTNDGKYMFFDGRCESFFHQYMGYIESRLNEFFEEKTLSQQQIQSLMLSAPISTISHEIDSHIDNEYRRLSLLFMDKLFAYAKKLKIKDKTLRASQCGGH